jgi:hypothetical protein
MPLSPQDLKAFETLANDPEDLRVLVERLKRHPEHKDHPILKLKETEDRLLAPIASRLEEVEAKLKASESNDFYEKNRAELRARGWSKDNIAKLEKRMQEDPEFPLFHSYAKAADYIARIDTPLAPSSVSPVFDGLGGAMQNQSAGWREDMQSDDPKKNPMLMNRRARKADARRRWAEARDEELNRIQGRLS